MVEITLKSYSASQVQTPYTTTSSEITQMEGEK